MSKWGRVKLRDLYEVHNGLSKSRKFFGHGHPFLTFSTVFNHFFLPENLGSSVESTPEEQRSFSIKRGDVFITRTSETAEELGMSAVALIDYPQATYNGFCKRLRPISDRRILPEYAGYVLRAPEFRNRFYGLAGSMTSRASLRNDDLLEMDIPLPELSVQRKVSKCLFDYDSAIDNARRQIALLEEAAMRLYREWFDGTGKRWKRTPVVLADVLERLGTGLNPRKNFTLGHGENFYVTIKNMANNRVYLDSKCDKVDDEAIRKINRRSDLRKGDVLFSGIGTIGRAYLIAEAPKNWNTSESVFNLRANSRITPEFLYMLMLSSKMQQYAMNNATGCAQKGIRAAALRAYQFDLAPLIEIEKFTEQVRPMLNAVNDLNKKIDSLTEARDRLLPKLMSGEIEV